MAITITGDRGAMAVILREAADRVLGGGSYEWQIPSPWSEQVSILFAPADGAPQITMEEED